MSFIQIFEHFFPGVKQFEKYFLRLSLKAGIQELGIFYRYLGIRYSCLTQFFIEFFSIVNNTSLSSNLFIVQFVNIPRRSQDISLSRKFTKGMLSTALIRGH